MVSTRAALDAAVAEVMESQHFILGPEVEALEAEVERLTKMMYQAAEQLEYELAATLRDALQALKAMLLQD